MYFALLPIVSAPYTTIWIGLRQPTMQLAKRTLAILIMILLSACGFEVDDRVYGNWVEPLSGETIEFRADGTVNWFGSEGTLTVEKSAESCLSFPGLYDCPDGQVMLNVDGQNFKVVYYSKKFDRDPNRWDWGFRDANSNFMDITLRSKTASHFPVFREGFPGASQFTLEGFEQLESGLPHLYPFVNNAQEYNGEIVAQFAQLEPALWRYSFHNTTWQPIDVTVNNGIRFFPEVILNGDQYSIDGGYTWSGMPSLEDGKEAYSTEAFGVVLYAIYQIEGETFETYRTDLADPSPTWQKMGETHDQARYRALLSTKSDNILFRQVDNDNDNGFGLESSVNQGATWEPMESPCTNESQGHANGVYCNSAEGMSSWFDAPTNTWSTFASPQGTEPVRLTGPQEELYLVRDTTLIKVNSQGIETVVAELNKAPGSYMRVYVLESGIFLQSLSLWHQAF